MATTLDVARGTRALEALRQITGKRVRVSGSAVRDAALTGMGAARLVSAQSAGVAGGPQSLIEALVSGSVGDEATELEALVCRSWLAVHVTSDAIGGAPTVDLDFEEVVPGVAWAPLVLGGVLGVAAIMAGAWYAVQHKRANVVVEVAAARAAAEASALTGIASQEIQRTGSISDRTMAAIGKLSSPATIGQSGRWVYGLAGAGIVAAGVGGVMVGRRVA